MSPLCSRDIDRLQRAGRLLLTHMDAPPSLPELARAVGLNEFKLKAGFRSYFGTSAFGYLREQRMIRARELLVQRDLNVAEVAVRGRVRKPEQVRQRFSQTLRFPPVGDSVGAPRSTCSRLEPRCSRMERPQAAAARRFELVKFTAIQAWCRRVPVLACLPLLLPKVAAADETPGESADSEVVTATASLVTPIFGAYEAEARVRASSAWSVLVNASFLTLDHEGWSTKTGTVGVGLSYFFQKRGLRGWYAEAIGELMLSSWRHESSHEVAPLVPGVTGIVGGGYQFVWEFGAVLDLGAGAVVLHFPSATTELGGESSEALTKVYPGVKVNVGWAF